MTENLPLHPRRTTAGPVDFRQEGAVVAPATPSPPVVLNPTALALWELCDGSTAVEEMVAAVSELFGLTRARARADVQSALADMRATGVIR